MPPPSTSMAAWPASVSQPVVIPKRHTLRTSASNDGRHRRGNVKVHHVAAFNDQHHRPEKMKPAVAALLAVTSIPKPRSNGRKSTSRDVRHERIRTEELVAALCAGDNGVEEGDVIGVSASCLEMLMSPPTEEDIHPVVSEADDDDEEDGSSLEREEVSALPSRSPSVSYESTPSLETDNSISVTDDDDSASSVFSSCCAHTRSSRTRSKSTTKTFKRRPSLNYQNYPRRGARALSFSSPPPEDCQTSHPLLPPLLPAPQPQTIEADPASPTPPAIRAHPPRPSALSFKSNLTLSLRAIRSFSRSLSTTFPLLPVVRPDDFLTCSIPYTDERRPMLIPSEEGQIPTPETRRYFNPTSLSSAPISSSKTSSFDFTEKLCKASIQMQAYPIPQRTSSTPQLRWTGSPKGSTPVELDNTSAAPPPRQREARENPDFLRVIVLEMNMRKVGKLSKTVPGRARFALPARAVMKSSIDEGPSSEVDTPETARIPKRWIGWVA